MEWTHYCQLPWGARSDEAGTTCDKRYPALQEAFIHDIHQVKCFFDGRYLKFMSKMGKFMRASVTLREVGALYEKRLEETSQFVFESGQQNIALSTFLVSDAERNREEVYNAGIICLQNAMFPLCVLI